MSQNNGIGGDTKSWNSNRCVVMHSYMSNIIFGLFSRIIAFAYVCVFASDCMWLTGIQLLADISPYVHFDLHVCHTAISTYHLASFIPLSPAKFISAYFWAHTLFHLSTVSQTNANWNRPYVIGYIIYIITYNTAKNWEKTLHAQQLAALSRALLGKSLWIHLTREMLAFPLAPQTTISSSHPDINGKMNLFAFQRQLRMRYCYTHTHAHTHTWMEDFWEYFVEFIDLLSILCRHAILHTPIFFRTSAILKYI